MTNSPLINSNIPHLTHASHSLPRPRAQNPPLVSVYVGRSDLLRYNPNMGYQITKTRLVFRQESPETGRGGAKIQRPRKGLRREVARDGLGWGGHRRRRGGWRGGSMESKRRVGSSVQRNRPHACHSRNVWIISRRQRAAIMRQRINCAVVDSLLKG